MRKVRRLLLPVHPCRYMTRLFQIELAPQVLRDAQAGKPAAQAQLYRAFSSAAYGVIRRLIPAPVRS